MLDGLAGYYYTHTTEQQFSMSIYCLQCSDTVGWAWWSQLRFYVLLDTKQVISKTFPMPITWFGMENLNLTQQKHALI